MPLAARFHIIFDIFADIADIFMPPMMTLFLIDAAAFAFAMPPDADAMPLLR
jgi:hypothetical protein